MQSYTTADRHGYSVQFSPFAPDHLLVATSQLYGLAGGGSLFLLKHTPDADKGIKELRRLEWSDGLFDVAWSPYASHVAATASGDGSLQIWTCLDPELSDISDILTQKSIQPKACLQEHKNEVYSIDWGVQWNSHQILSASWDGLLKLWDCNRLNSIVTFSGHTDLIYCAKFSPLIANLFASVSTDGYLNLWNSFDFTGKPLMSIHASHSSELISIGWNQFDRNGLVTGDASGCIRVWDLRNLRHHVVELHSGDFAVRRLAFSPSAASVLASANYDFTTRIWNLSQSLEVLEIMENHSEFVCGLDWNSNQSHQLADCGWDAVVNVFTPHSLIDVHG